ncbi:MAG: rhodanese-like domain-containing protein [Clostridia bacterium]|nr:rhodanese-like domain-containing protein [Clostridia bacterium]
MLIFGNINQGLEDFRAAPGAILVDVREADEFSGGHIPGAVNVPLPGILCSGLPRDVPLFLYCLRGTRSKRAARMLKRMGYNNVRSIGGIMGYQGKLTHGDHASA